MERAEAARAGAQLWGPPPFLPSHVFPLHLSWSPRWRRPRPAAAAPWQPPKVSTLASWTSIVYTTWYGCESYIASPYSPDNPSKVATDLGAFQGYKCYDIPAYSDAAKPGLALVFYQVAT